MTTDVVSLWFEISHVDGLILRPLNHSPLVCVCSRFHVQTTTGTAMITDVVKLGWKLKLRR